MSPRRSAAAVLALVVALTSCSARGLAFRTDHAVDIVSPLSRQEVQLPVRLTWHSRLAKGAFYAAFIDRAPIRPGQSLAVLADDSCQRTPRCPDLQYLRDRDVFVTDGDSLLLDSLPQKPSSARASARDRHTATIVRLDSRGRRVGEAAYIVEFTVKETR